MSQLTLMEITHVMAMNDQGYTKKQIAEAVGVNERTIYRILSGESKKKIRQIADRIEHFGKGYYDTGCYQTNLKTNFDEFEGTTGNIESRTVLFEPVDETFEIVAAMEEFGELYDEYYRGE